MHWGTSGLRDEQVAFLQSVFDDPVLVADDSWGLLDTRVLHVRDAAGDYVVKASGPDNAHFPRELAAHRDGWTSVLGARTSRLVAADEDARVLVLDRLPGRLALGSPHEDDPDVHRQAGTVLRRFHQQSAREDPQYLHRERDKVLRLLDHPHRIDADTAERVRALFETWVPHPVTVVPTHGDWHPRNWLVDRGRLLAIDYGRFALRPAATDCTRLAVLYWERRPELERAFLDGYGEDPRDPEDWRWLQLREAVGTAVWAYAVHDEAFEAQGHRMLRDALTAF